MKQHVSSYIGILGDPAKLDLYGDEFYDILNYDESNSCFYLIGASENDVTKNQYKQMYDLLQAQLLNSKYPPIKHLSGSTDFRSRIGLFPSSSTHLIKGPSFSFAPFPVNSKSWYLKFKSRFLSKILRPVLPFAVRTLAYVPQGGKAAMKTKAEPIQLETLPQIFENLRTTDKFDWYYLEAGSGEEFIPSDIINKVLNAQFVSIGQKSRKTISEYENFDRIIIPNFVYGGGIRTKAQIKLLLDPSEENPKLIPEIIIVGNLSEENISKTYELVDLVGELNELKTATVNN